MKRKSGGEAASSSKGPGAVDYKKELDTWRKGIYVAAQKSLEKDFPKKVEDLDALYNSDDFASSWPAFDVKNFQVEGDTVPIRTIPKRIEACNAKLKRESREFLASIVNVKMWVQLNMPKIEDGGQFGVEVQEEMVEQVSV